MGAASFHDYAVGRTAAEAFRTATESARYEYGHGGYTGTVAEKHDAIVIDLPPRVTVKRLLDALYEVYDVPFARWEGRKLTAAERRAEQRLVDWFGQREADRLIAAYYDKWGPAIMVPLRGAEAKECRRIVGAEGKRGTAYAIVGLASE